jgi:sulfur carrier protein
MVSISVNGKPFELNECQTVSDLIAAQGVDGRGMAVAVNGRVVRRVDWEQTQLSEGDQVRLVRPIGVETSSTSSIPTRFLLPAGPSSLVYSPAQVDSNRRPFCEPLSPHPVPRW